MAANRNFSGREGAVEAGKGARDRQSMYYPLYIGDIHLTELQKGITCTLRGKRPSHTAPHNSLINCRRCHAAKCFWHALDGNVHSSEALLASRADPNNTTWHQLHQAARRRDIPSLQTWGQPVGMAERLVFFASNFSSTSPVNSETSVGFYDGRGLRVWPIFGGVCELMLTCGSDSHRIGIRAWR